MRDQQQQQQNITIIKYAFIKVCALGTLLNKIRVTQAVWCYDSQLENQGGY
jgi:hypothetical protein